MSDQTVLLRIAEALEKQAGLLEAQYQMNLEIQADRKAMQQRMEEHDAMMGMLLRAADGGELDG